VLALEPALVLEPGLGLVLAQGLERVLEPE